MGNEQDKHRWLHESKIVETVNDTEYGKLVYIENNDHK